MIEFCNYHNGVVSHDEADPGGADYDGDQALEGVLDEGLVERVQVVRRPRRVADEQVEEPGEAKTEEGQEVFAFAALKENESLY